MHRSCLLLAALGALVILDSKARLQMSSCPDNTPHWLMRDSSCEERHERCSTHCSTLIPLLFTWCWLWELFLGWWSPGESSCLELLHASTFPVARH
jgi:hypothetical protein